MAVKRNEMGFEVFEKGHGKKQNQKLKPYLVLQYLLRQSDENHVISAENIEMYYKDLLLIISKNIYYVLKHKIFLKRKFGYIIYFFILQYCWCDYIKK